MESENIPKEWKIVKLTDISLDLLGGGTPSTSNPNYWDGGIAWMTSAHINGKNITTGQRYITKEGLKNSATNLVPKDNLLVATRVGIGKIAVNKIDIAISQDLTGVIIDKHKATSDFLYWCLGIKERRLKSLAQGSTIKGILREDLGKLELHLPPLPEQKKIAEVLSTADRAIEKVNDAIKKTERLKKGLMHELLTKGIGHKKFKGTKIGRIPEEWEVKSIDEIGTLQYGVTKTATKDNTEIRFLRITDITDQGIKWDGVPYCELTKSELEKYELKQDDVLFARIGATTGKTCFIEKTPQSVYGSYLLRFTPTTEGINTKFIYFFTQSLFYWRQVNANKGGQLKGGLNTKLLGNIKLPLPSLPEQQKISEIMGTVDKKLELLRVKKERFERIKKGLMGDLLTGKKRVKLEA